jgi:hypothetical protein
VIRVTGPLSDSAENSTKRRGGTTRSAVLREFAAIALRRRRAHRAAAMHTVLEDATPHGGRSAELVANVRGGQASGPGGRGEGGMRTASAPWP